MKQRFIVGLQLEIKAENPWQAAVAFFERVRAASQERHPLPVQVFDEQWQIHSVDVMKE